MEDNTYQGTWMALDDAMAALQRRMDLMREQMIDAFAVPTEYTQQGGQENMPTSMITIDLHVEQAEGEGAGGLVKMVVCHPGGRVTETRVVAMDAETLGMEAALLVAEALDLKESAWSMAIEQLTTLARFFQEEVPGQVEEGTPVENAIRLLRYFG